ncbi:MAG: 16S rRNA (cytosine(1402)-N(4))-methyltransferase [Chloroflexi bacterium]|nr:16S rRNA (cytosine(1402)-N(4))-methyltransferase [Chloroflexota bacterium]|tara:strand:- start:2134 stop:2952 length:819 start_codon:yes stop_codon:yes gene_type:complete
MAGNDFSFQTFSKNEFYGNLNARLIDMADLASDRKIVDLACGTGGVTRLILERINQTKDTVVIALDHSSTALKTAMDDLKDISNNAVRYVQLGVENVSDAVKDSVDAIVFCNAIHYLPDKDAVVADICNTLKPGGKFVFNTSFYEGGQHEDSTAFYSKWMFKAMKILRRKYGLSPVRSEKVQSRQQLTPKDYEDLLNRNGLKVFKQEVDTVPVPVEGWLDISTFSDFIEGTMPGVPMDKASLSLQEAVKETYSELGVSHVPRNWLDIVAVKK